MTARRQNIIAAIVVLNVVWIGALVTVHELALEGRPLPLEAGIANVNAAPVDPREFRMRDVWDRGIGDRAPVATTFLRTGIEIPAQWPDQPRLAATRVSMHVVQLPIDQVIKALSTQSHVRLDLSPTNLLTRPNAPHPFISIDGDSIPLEEAMLRFCTQSNLMMLAEEPSGGQRNIAPIDGSPRILLVSGNGNRRAGTWSVSGAFAFDLLHIDQTAVLRPDGLADNSIVLAINMHVEPKVWVLAPATAMTVTEMVDENGKSLLAAPATIGQTGNWGRNLAVKLPADHGHWIGRLRVDSIWTIGATPASVTIPDVAKAAGSKLSAGGIDALIQSIAQPTDPSQVNTQLSLAAVYTQRSGATLDWPTIGPLLRRGRVWIDGWGAPASIQARADNKAKPPTVQITYQWNNMQRGAPGAMHIELPLGADKVHVPMEFHNVPLP
jgi:hypothetical protein